NAIVHPRHDEVCGCIVKITTGTDQPRHCPFRRKVHDLGALPQTAGGNFLLHPVYIQTLPISRPAAFAGVTVVGCHLALTVMYEAMVPCILPVELRNSRKRDIGFLAYRTWIKRGGLAVRNS